MAARCVSRRIFQVAASSLCWPSNAAIFISSSWTRFSFSRLALAIALRVSASRRFCAFCSRNPGPRAAKSVEPFGCPSCEIWPAVRAVRADVAFVIAGIKCQPASGPSSPRDESVRLAEKRFTFSQPTNWLAGNLIETREEVRRCVGF